MLFDECACYVVAEASAYACYFEGVGEAVVDEDAAGQWEHLGFVLQAAEGGGENEAVVVSFEFCAVVFFGVLRQVFES